KDPSKVDRSAAYYARYIAKNLVAARLCSRVEVQLAYAIGVARPVSIAVETFGTGTISDEALADLVEHHFDARPASLIRELDLLKPIFFQTAAYGHFGRNEPGFTWERTDRAEALADAAKGKAS
ncbi:MAG: methionine adenosyltransferase domain-containing protein, partial [Myxococcales bacterium]|nr:methionine adenosyltransferase domain-containing protein [Myxococcales bacterium]